MDTKHSAAPWTVSEHKGVLYVDTPAQPFLPGYERIDTFTVGPDTAKNRANAQLIAAAPELLQACRLALSSLQAAGFANATVTLCEAAIAKAEGDPNR